MKAPHARAHAATRGIEIKLQKVDGSGKDDLIKLKEKCCGMHNTFAAVCTMQLILSVCACGTSLKDRAAESKKKLESSIVLIKKNKEGVATTSMLDTAKDMRATVPSVPCVIKKTLHYQIKVRDNQLVCTEEKVDKIDQALAASSVHNGEDY
eukprot:6471877-Amphidinium_carterae.1